jgi:hypothetical protein
VLKPVVDEHVNDMLKKGLIEPNISPWSRSILLVRKNISDGCVKYGFCVDYKSLNAVTKPEAYPLPNIVDTLDLVRNNKMFSVLDMALGYHQIKIQEEDKEQTEFSYYRGHYWFMKLPLGVNNGPASHQRCMQLIWTVLNGIDYLAYLSETLEEAFVKLKEAMSRELSLV